MNQEQIKELARARARDILGNNQIFRNLPVAEQKAMYLDVVSEQMQQLMYPNRGGLSRGMQEFVGKSSDLLNDERHERGFEAGVDSFEDLVDAVDFPQFVADLLQSVFDANITVMKAQTDDYIRLMKQATTDLATFIRQIDETTTFAYLAENTPDQFGISMEEDENGAEKMVLTNPQGEKVDVEDNEVKVKIMEAKIRMAQEHRAALREMILMGVTRLVVEKGEVEAEVNFEFKGKRDVEKKDKAMVQTQKSTSSSSRSGGGFLGAIFGGNRGGSTTSTRQTQLSVSSTKSQATDQLSAKLRGYVNIKFKTDYFKLDNFAQMYGPVNQDAQKAASGPGPQALLTAAGKP